MTTKAPPLTMHEAVDYAVEIGGNHHHPRRVSGVEGLTSPFRFEIRFRTDEGAELIPDEVVEASAELRILRGGELLRRLFGVFTEARLSATARGTSEVVAILEPRIALLQFRSNCRVFRDKTAIEIVTEVLREIEVGVELRLRGSYKRRPYTVQYNETDLAFVSRLLEEEGVFHAFPSHVTPPEDAMAAHRVVLGDGPHAYEAVEGLAPLPLRATGGLEEAEEAILEMSARAQMGPGRVAVRDWNLERPSARMDCVAPGPTSGAPEFYRYPGGFELPAEGEQRARILAEGFACRASTFAGRSSTARIAPGHAFQLVDPPGGHPYPLEGEYVVTSLEHDFERFGEDGASGAPRPRLDLRFRALDAAMPFRPEPRTPRPTITGLHTGFVTGPAGQDIHTDEYGRVKVHFHWDRGQPQDDTCSFWIPVLQDNTGHSAATPRVGWEVLVGFVDGDPDRPFVLGRTYNGQDPFPEVLPAGKTKSSLRSLSSPGRDGRNEIWIDDAAGKELVSLRAEKDMNVVVAHDKKETVEATEENTVVEDETIRIGRHNTVHVKEKVLVAVDGDQSITVDGSRSRKVNAAEEITVKGKRATSIGGLHFRKIGGFDNVGVKKGLSETVGGADVEVSLKENSTNASLLQTLTVGGAVVEIAGQGKAEEAEMLRVETIGMLLLTKVSKLFGIEVKKKRSTNVGQTLMASAKGGQGGEGTVLLKAGEALKAAVGKLEAFGKEGLVIRSGGSEVILDKEGITMKSDKDIVISATGASDLAAGNVKFT